MSYRPNPVRSDSGDSYANQGIPGIIPDIDETIGGPTKVDRLQGHEHSGWFGT